VAQLKLFGAVTDGEWYGLLSKQAKIEEVNSWQPIDSHEFRSLEPIDVESIRIGLGTPGGPWL
jgi:hypothetical protein